MAIFWIGNRVQIPILYSFLEIGEGGGAYGESHNRHMKEHEKTISWMAPLLIIQISTR